MDLFKWKQNLKLNFPEIMGKLFAGKKEDSSRMNLQPLSVSSTNFSDSGKTFELSLDVPGLKKKDIKLELREDSLILSSEQKFENEEKHAGWYRRETGYNAFHRVIPLPDLADPDKIEARLKNGRLKIKIGKSKRIVSGNKQIAVK